MKITLQPVQAFNVSLEDIPVGTFTIDSEWNGLSCLKEEGGAKIIAGLDAPGILDPLFNPEGKRTGTAVTVSPSILALLPAASWSEDDGTPV